MEPDEGDTSFHYLTYESCEIDQGGKKWKAYGSPVRSYVSSQCSKPTDLGR